jgi:hypothetical protein
VNFKGYGRGCVVFGGTEKNVYWEKSISPRGNVILALWQKANETLARKWLSSQPYGNALERGAPLPPHAHARTHTRAHAHTRTHACANEKPDLVVWRVACVILTLCQCEPAENSPVSENNKAFHHYTFLLRTSFGGVLHEWRNTLIHSC